MFSARNMLEMCDTFLPGSSMLCQVLYVIDSNKYLAYKVMKCYRDSSMYKDC